MNRDGEKAGRPYIYSEASFIIFFMLMQYRRIFDSKSQWHWLHQHADVVEMLGWQQIPHRTTIRRRYECMYTVVQEFVLFAAQHVADEDVLFSQKHLVEDKSLFKALGPVWHQWMRLKQWIPATLRKLDTAATWCKSAYHGWVYGYGLHITCNEDAFPVMLQVETASVSESQTLNQKEERILNQLGPQTLAADNAYTKAMRIRAWQKRGVLLLTPARKWVHGRFAQRYHELIKLPEMAAHLRRRRTSVEPLFDLIAQVIGAYGPQKQLPLQGLDKVRSCLALATLSVQIAMIANSRWGLPHRNISNIAAAFQ